MMVVKEPTTDLRLNPTILYMAMNTTRATSDRIRGQAQLSFIPTQLRLAPLCSSTESHRKMNAYVHNTSQS